ncbi:hypothetical protein [Thalassospira xiamenensis]|uniref:Uncharacterized protein n=1 Tax=Thalassospira xiamenensis TaxID=220697 RepID=A0A285TH32_9PROT|nr:hypothetical protein [Thalassospira xiamenensis]SOC21544.1 hypothetical protein SAMN05428964_103435 [Thalassospira xiamenensis]
MRTKPIRGLRGQDENFKIPVRSDHFIQLVDRFGAQATEIGLNLTLPDGAYQEAVGYLDVLMLSENKKSEDMPPAPVKLQLKPEYFIVSMIPSTSQDVVTCEVPSLDEARVQVAAWKRCFRSPDNPAPRFDCCAVYPDGLTVQFDLYAPDEQLVALDSSGQRDDRFRPARYDLSFAVDASATADLVPPCLFIDYFDHPYIGQDVSIEQPDIFDSSDDLATWEKPFGVLFSDGEPLIYVDTKEEAEFVVNTWRLWNNIDPLAPDKEPLFSEEELTKYFPDIAIQTASTSLTM